MFDKVKALFAGKTNPAPIYPTTISTAPPVSRALPKPTVEHIHDAGQKAHDEIANWGELWAAGRKDEIPDKYRPLFSHYLSAFVRNDKATADRHYATLRKARTIEILDSWGFPDPAAQ